MPFEVSSRNIETNMLPAGITEEQVAEAVRTSGYPLQTRVAALLDESFLIQEEWGFADRETGAHRTLDLMAERSFGSRDPNQFRVRPMLNLLVECKQSDLPFVFFLADARPIDNFPMIAGLGKHEIAVKTDDDLSRWIFTPQQALDLRNLNFAQAPPLCSTLSKCVRKGKEIQLSGSESFNSIVQPLLSAAEHFRSTSAPPKTAFWFSAHAVLGIAVLDAPMIGVRVRADCETFEFVPWVRVLRHEPSLQKGSPRDYWGAISALDFIHKDFLSSYLEYSVVPFMSEFQKRVQRHDEELATGRGFIAGMGATSPLDIEAALRPSTASVGPPLDIPPTLRNRVRTVLFRMLLRLRSISRR